MQKQPSSTAEMSRASHRITKEKSVIAKATRLILKDCVQVVEEVKFIAVGFSKKGARLYKSTQDTFLRILECVGLCMSSCSVISMPFHVLGVEDYRYLITLFVTVNNAIVSSSFCAYVIVNAFKIVQNYILGLKNRIEKEAV